MIRTLFFKIFLWFWLAMALVAVAIMVATQTTQPDPTATPRRQMTGNVAAVVAHTAANIFDRDGQAALAEYLERVEHTTRIHAVLFDRQGRELSGRALPPGSHELLARVRQSGKVEFKVVSRTLLAGQQTMAVPGPRYVLIGTMRRDRMDEWLRDPRTQVLRLLALLLTAGVVCYGLASYLTAPIIKLRAATQQLAAGDLTARVGAAVGKRRDELADLGRDFDRMAERLQSLVSAQRALLSDISHELRSPLARLNVALGLARQRAGPEAAGALDRIEREAERLNTLIGQLLMLVRLENDAPTSEPAPVDLLSLVNEVAADADFEARSRQRAVRVVAGEACATTGAAGLLRSAVENILRNAVHYTAEGTEVEVALVCRRNGAQSHALIRVRDHGPGVAEANLIHLFRPFYRVAAARDRQTGGTGLGLAIAERAVRVHGGRVTAANAPDGGLIVEIHLPLAQTEMTPGSMRTRN